MLAVLLFSVKFHAVRYFSVRLPAVLFHRLWRDVEGESRFHAAFPPHVALAQAKRLMGRQVKRLDPCDSSLGRHALQHGAYLPVLLVHSAYAGLRIAFRRDGAIGWLRLSPVTPFVYYGARHRFFSSFTDFTFCSAFMMASTPMRTSFSSYPFVSISL